MVSTYTAIYKKHEIKCYECKYCMMDGNVVTCSILRGVDCFHNKNEPWKYFVPINYEFIKKNEFLIV